MNGLMEQMRALGPARLAAIAGVGVALIGLVIFFATRFTTPPYELLYSNLEQADAQAIVQSLEDQNIPYQLANNGTEIRVPEDVRDRMRLQTAELAVGGGASVGYEVFDNTSALGSTNFIQNVNLVRAQEGELARTIRSIDGVRHARVHLVLPRREVFSRETNEPSASVMVATGRATLDSGQVIAIQNLIAAAVPKMSPQQVSIIDERGRMLTRGMDQDGALAAMTQDELRRAEEQRLARSIETLLGRTLGPGSVRAEVHADMNFNRVVTNEESYDPDQQVVRSTVTVEENSSSTEGGPSPVTVGQNLPEGQFDQAEGATASTNESRTEETVNYEISRRVTNTVRDRGVIDRLSVAVLVDGARPTGPDGAPTYEDRTPQEMENITALVQSAIGYDQQRGDQIEVINMRFADLDNMFGDEEPWMFMGFTKDEIMRMAEGLGVAIVAILVILLVVRPLVTRAFESLPSGADGGSTGLLSAEAAGAPQLAGPVTAPVPIGLGDDDMEDVDELIDIEKVEGRVKASSLRKIGEIVDKHPEEALSIIRNWLYQEN
ncbi:flagellar M-ring protein FliF [Roseospira marina]|uniref:Flagellar M-ring protein n=2 Tax=Roseospira marina TaxID=140057 RepID=A0A5M6IDP0_9PROT|nr:flagellar basal-body MS-ring/collar protein FliF [Roseospira marina]KAA5605718.1 flagellar M-ring protein FliF [Roseospira marina]MBB5086681.1 flagellar M-ring protein FliF [Roseospira marina]